VKYYVVNSEGKDFFEVNEFTGEIFTKIVFDRERQGAYALAIEARDSAPSARPNSGGQPNTGNVAFLSPIKLLHPARVSVTGVKATSLDRTDNGQSVLWEGTMGVH